MTEGWKKTFQEKMEDYSEPAPEGMWEDILSAMGPETVRPHRKTVLIPVLSLMSAAAALLLFLLLFRESGNPALPANAAVLLSGGEPVLLSASRLPSPSGIPTLEPRITEVTRNISPSRDTVQAAVIPQTQTGAEVREAMPPEETTAAKEVPDYSGETAAFAGEADWGTAEEGRRSAGKAVFGLYAGGMTGNSENYRGYDGRIRELAEGRTMRYGEGPTADIMMFNRDKEVSTDTRHFLPVKAGVTVSWQFAPRWQLQTGLYYSWLLSKTDSGSDSYFVRSRQHLNYIGLPLMIGADLWQHEVADFYLSAGGMVERYVGGKVSKEYFYDGEMRFREKEKVHTRPWQWSVSASAGIEFHLGRRIGLYAEPGIIWYFDNGSTVQSTYTEHPLNFNLNIGLRFRL